MHLGTGGARSLAPQLSLHLLPDPTQTLAKLQALPLPGRGSGCWERVRLGKWELLGYLEMGSEQGQRGAGWELEGRTRSEET